jgi:hypothetical protein
VATATPFQQMLGCPIEGHIGSFSTMSEEDVKYAANRVFNQNLIQNALLAKYHFAATLPKIVSWNFTKCNFRFIRIKMFFLHL